MKYLLGLIASFGLLLLVPSYVFASDYYVSNSGNDGNNGSINSPWKTIQKAANTMVAGDTAYIHSGTYYETVIPAHSGNSNQYITYRNFGDGDVVIDGQGGTRVNSIRVSNQSYLQFIGLTLRNNGYTSGGFAAYAGTNHIILDNITSELSRFGILLKGNKTSSEDPSNTVSFITIKNSTIRNNAAYGIFVYYKTTDVVIANNVIYNENDKNGVPVDDQYGIDIDTDYPGDPANGPRRITVIGNEIYGNRIQGIRPWNGWYILIKDNHVHNNGASGIQVEDGCQYVVVEGNHSENNAQSYEYETGIWIDSTVNAVVQNNVLNGNQIGLMVTDSNRVLLRNNIIYQNNRAPSGSNVMGTVLNTNSSNITFVHNTLWKNGVSGSRGNLMACSHPPLTNTLVKNNIFSEATGSNDSSVLCSIISDFNDYYNTRNLLIGWLGSNYSWTNYQNTSKQDNHSITGNPQFVDSTNYNFALSPNSPDIDSADYLAKTTSAGSGTTIPVTNASYFSNGMNLVQGDNIRIGSNTVKVTNVDYSSNTLTVDRNINWNTSDPVSYLYSGNSPDIGALEYGSNNQTPSPSFVPTSTPAPTPTPAAKPGDANGDGQVNEADYAIWLAHFSQRTGSGPSVGDFDRNGIVDGVDYTIWLNNYGK
jgi:parallel beta-helix repeat protein